MTHRVTCIFALWLQFLAAFSEKYSHYEHYTVLSKPVMTPGIYEFSYMGLINDTEIESYNSENRIKIPEQYWKRERLSEDYWKKGTARLRDEEEWMRNEFNKMMTVMGHSQSDPDVHVLQRRRGCEVERLSDGSVKFLSGSEQYRYDGQDFLFFNLHTEQWETLNDQALSIKQRWDRDNGLKHETLGYIKKTCVDWAEKLMKYEDDYIRSHSPPDVYAFSKKASTLDKLELTCFATGFSPKKITMKIEGNYVQMREKLESTGVRPNGDGTHQLRMMCDEIPESDREKYYCFVNHRALETPIVKIWDGNCDGERVLGGIIGGVVGSVLTLMVVGVIIFGLYKRGIIYINVQPRTFDQSGGVSVVTMGSPPVRADGGLPVNTPLLTETGSNDRVSNGADSGHESSNSSSRSSNESITVQMLAG